MACRVMTPYSGFPDGEYLSALESDYQHSENVVPTSSKRKLQHKCIQHGLWFGAVTAVYFYLEWCIRFVFTNSVRDSLSLLLLNLIFILSDKQTRNRKRRPLAANTKRQERLCHRSSI